MRRHRMPASLFFLLSIIVGSSETCLRTPFLRGRLAGEIAIYQTMCNTAARYFRILFICGNIEASFCRATGIIKDICLE